MTTPSRKLRHNAEASLTVFINEGVGGKNSLFQYCKDAIASLEPKIPKSHQEQATDAVNSLL